MRSSVFVAVVASSLLGCGDDGSAPLDAAPDAAINVGGPYHRVLPGYNDEATCRAANPDPLFHCIEQVDLCPGGRTDALFTDIVTSGTWSLQESPLRVIVVIASTPELTHDGQVELDVRRSGALYSIEVYGDKEFVPGGDLLCPR